MTGTIYRLGSAPMVYAPGIVRWAINGYKFKESRQNMMEVITTGWGIPATAAALLLSGKVEYYVEGETVVFAA